MEAIVLDMRGMFLVPTLDGPHAVVVDETFLNPHQQVLALDEYTIQDRLTEVRALQDANLQNGGLNQADAARLTALHATLGRAFDCVSAAA